MTLPEGYESKYVYHFTHISNLPRILEKGFLSDAELARRDCEHLSIAESEIKRRRARMPVPCGPGGTVNDYVPFYFCSRTPMHLAVIKKRNVDQEHLIYLKVPLRIVSRSDVVFTAASANTEIPPAFYEDPQDLSKLNWVHAIDPRKWSWPDDDLRHQRMAELLVHKEVPLDWIEAVEVWGDETAELVKGHFRAARAPCPAVTVNKLHYFQKRQGNRFIDESLIAGPARISQEYTAAVEAALSSTSTGVAATYATAGRLLDAIEANFGAVQETADIVGLQSENGVHKHSVDIHTLDMVKQLEGLPEYASLDQQQRRLLKLAAYLHDIGKGPRSRWAWNGGLQQNDPDHPIGSMRMTARILAREVAEVKAKTARRLIKLVGYHDLIGDIIGRGRELAQLREVASSREEVRLLVMLGKADVLSLVPAWWDEDAEAEVLRQAESWDY